MKHALQGFLAGIVFSATPALAAPAITIERLDPRLDAILPPGAVVETVVDGHDWVEGPAWSAREGALFFSDIPRNSVYRWRPGGAVELFLRPSGYGGTAPFAGREPGANGLAFDSQGRLHLCEHGDRRVTRLEPDGRKTVLADRYDGKRLNSPNDLVLGPDGSVTFTDPPFGLPEAFDDPARELDFAGVYRVTPDGRVGLLTRALRAPNGLGYSPDGKTLYVSNADAAHPLFMAFAVGEDGGLDGGRIFFDATPWVGSAPGAPDGLVTDRRGNVLAGGPGGLYLLSPEGVHLGTIRTGVATSNAAFGEDGSTLFITADHSVLRVRLGTSGPLGKESPTP